MGRRACERLAIEAAAEHDGRTVLRVVHDVGGFSHAAARGLVAAGAVRRNGTVVERGDDRVRPRDRIEIVFDPDRTYRAPSPPARTEGFRVVLEDSNLVVVDKEPGLLSVPVPSAKGDSVAELLLGSYRARGHRRPVVLPAHRIDRYTSGLVAFARSRAAWAALRSQFASGAPERVYLAVATGRVERERGTLEHRLEEDPRSLKVRASPRGRRAASAYRVLERFPHATLLEVHLDTGRRNQIRVQLAAEGHPLVGDHSYGKPSPLIGRTALHAARLAFDHPTTGKRVELASPLPRDLERLVSRLRKGDSP
jgi:RluA family pseudouridine synthase